MENRAESETIVENLPMLMPRWSFVFYFYFVLSSIKMTGEQEKLGGLLIVKYIILVDIFDH